MEIALGYVGIDFIAPTVPNGERERERKNKLVTVIFTRFEASFFLFSLRTNFIRSKGKIYYLLYVRI